MAHLSPNHVSPVHTCLVNHNLRILAKYAYEFPNEGHYLVLNPRCNMAYWITERTKYTTLPFMRIRTATDVSMLGTTDVRLIDGSSKIPFESKYWEQGCESLPDDVKMGIECHGHVLIIY